ncbi:hypothetical protein [Priestia megaterium]|uniref:hypothetical protein n=1 Tax=Priestia megaterium TaxID=1404 RepID=UPI0018859178|nr:hypothetical protein [Priestia megaterium]
MKRKSRVMDRLIAFFIVGAMVLIILAVTLLSILFFWMESALGSEFLRKKPG